MDNKEKYIKAFVAALDIPEADVRPDLAYQDIENWDSVGHMELVAELEEAFDIMFEAEDIIAFSSFQKVIEILAKYGVIID